MQQDDTNPRRFLKIMFAIGAFALGLKGCSDMGDSRRLTALNKTALTEPVSNVIVHQARGVTGYSAEIRFRTDFGRSVATTRSIPEEIAKDLQAGKRVRIFYNPANPAEFIFAEQKPAWPYLLGAAVLAVLALLF